MEQLWQWPRVLWAGLSKQLQCPTIPPFADEIETMIIFAGLFSAITCSETSIMPILFVLHALNGVRWQFIPTYCFYLGSAVLGFQQNAFLSALLASTCGLTFTTCLFVPAVPPIQTYGFSVGVQDIAFDGFIARCFYPAEPHASGWYIAKLTVVTLGIFVTMSCSNFSDRDSYMLLACWLLYSLQILLTFKLQFSRYIPEGFPVIFGMADFAELPRFLFSHMSTMSIVCFQDAALLPSSGHKIVLMVPGLGGLRTSYSRMCQQFASAGYFVVCLESSDGTPCTTVYADATVRKYKPYKRAKDEGPSSPGEHEFRHGQLIHRSKELTKIMKLVTGPRAEFTDVSVAYIKSKAGVLETMFPAIFARHKYHRDIQASTFWRSLEGHKFDGSPRLVGHSFGGATVLHMATSDDTNAREFRETFGLQCVVALDPWMFPLSAGSKGQAPSSLDPPHLVTHAELFQWMENMEMERELVKAAKKVLHVRVRNAGHHDYSEIGQ